MVHPNERGESWLKKNGLQLASLLFSVLVIAAGGIYTYAMKAASGITAEKLAAFETQLAQTRTEVLKLDVRVQELSVQVDQHHLDNTRHIDERQWQLLQQQIKEISDMLKLHMRRTGS